MKKLCTIIILLMTLYSANAQRSAVNITDLQKTITDNVVKNYPGFTIKEASKVVSGDLTTFEVVVVKGSASETLCYDSTGKFMKKITAREGTIEKAKVSSPTALKKPAKQGENSGSSKPPVKK